MNWISQHILAGLGDGHLVHGDVATPSNIRIDCTYSDRGSQYASKNCRRLLTANSFVGSMRHKDNGWNNAVAESFFAKLKKERAQWKHYQARAEAQQDILDLYITMFYNSRRLRSYLDYTSPNDFESATAEQKKGV